MTLFRLKFHTGICIYVVLPDGTADRQPWILTNYALVISLMDHKCQVRIWEVRAACDAVRMYETLAGRAKYVKQKFDAEEAGTWACYAERDGAEAALHFTFYSNNRLSLFVGGYSFVLWQQTSKWHFKRSSIHTQIICPLAYNVSVNNILIVTLLDSVRENKCCLTTL